MNTHRPTPASPRAGAGPGSSVEDLLFWVFEWCLALVAAVSVVVWTLGQIAGRVFGAGRPTAPVAQTPGIAVRLTRHLTDPAQAWPATDQSRLPGVVGFTAALTLTLTAVALIAWGVVAVRGRVRPAGGGARFATRRDVNRLKVTHPTRRRITVGRHAGKLVALDEGVSLLVCGPTQSGKTSGLVIPAILEWDGVVIASSVKRDLLDHTLPHRTQQGRVHIYDPTASTGVPTDTWSPIHASTTWTRAQKTAGTLTEPRGNRDHPNDVFWATGASSLLAPCLLAAATAGLTMRDVMRWLNRKTSDEITDILTTAGEGAALDVAWAVEHADTRTRDGYYSTALAALQVYQDPTVQASAASCDITPDRLLDGGANTLYLCGPAHEQHRVRPVFEALLSQLVAAVADRHTTGVVLERPVLLVLDEAANIAAPPRLDQLISTAAAMGLQLITVWQDLAQLGARYGPERAQTVFSNSRARLILPGVADTTTLTELTRILGDTTVTQPHTTRNPDGGLTTSEGITYRPLMPADELRQLPPDHALLIYEALPPAVVTLRPWWRDKTLRALRNGDPRRAA